MLSQQPAEDGGRGDPVLQDPTAGGYDFTNDPRYVTLIITDNTAFSSSNTAEPVKYFAGFYATGWDTGNGSGKPKGCYGYPIAGTCGNPNNDAHPLLGCLAGNITSRDNGDMWGHFVKFVSFSSSGTPGQGYATCRVAASKPRRRPRRVAAAPSAIPCHDDRQGQRPRCTC